MKRLLRRYLSDVGQFLNVNLRGLVKIGATIGAAFRAGKSSPYETISKIMRVFAAKLNTLTNKFSGGLKSIIRNKVVAQIQKNDASEERGKLVSRPRFLIDVSIQHFRAVAATAANSAVIMARILTIEIEKLNTSMRSSCSVASRASGFDPNKILGESGFLTCVEALMLPKTVKNYAGKIRVALRNSSRLTIFDSASASSSAMSGSSSMAKMSIAHWLYPVQENGNLRIFQVRNASSLDGTITITNELNGG